MSDYTKTTNFTAKDALATGDPAKVVKGSEVDTEFDNIATAVATKANSLAPTLTGLTTVNNLRLSDTSDDHYYSFAVSELVADRTITLPLLAGNDTFVFEAHTQTLTNKTLTSPILTDAVLDLPQINDTSDDHQYIFAVNELTADRTVTLPLLTGNDTFVFESHTQTLTNKTLTSPTINTPTIDNPTITGQIAEEQYSLTGTSIDPANGTIQYKTFSGNTTFTENIQNGEAVTLHLTSGSSYTITWPTITWIGTGAGVAPTLTAFDVVTLWQVNDTLYGAYTGSST